MGRRARTLDESRRFSIDKFVVETSVLLDELHRSGADTFMHLGAMRTGWAPRDVGIAGALVTRSSRTTS